MADAFDITDPTQLTASPETEANQPLPMGELKPADQYDLNDPNVMFSEAALKRDKDFATIDELSALGYSGSDIASYLISKSDGPAEDVMATMSAKYEIEKREILEGNENRMAQYEENLRKSEERQAALSEQLKKKDSPLELDGGLSESGLDSSVSPEAVADPQLAQKYQELEADEKYSEYLNTYTTPKGVDSPELISLMAANDSLAEDSNMDYLSKILSSSLGEGNYEEAEEALYNMSLSGVEIPEDINFEDPDSLEAVKAFALAQQQKAYDDSIIHMKEVQEAYRALGIDYDLNPESDIDRAVALGEASKLLNEMDLTTQARQDAMAVQELASKAFEEHALGEWGTTIGQIASNWVTNTASLFTNVPMAAYYEAIGDEGKSAYYARKNNILDQFNSEIHKRAQMKIGLSEKAANTGITEIMMSDEFTKGDVALKMGAVFTQVLPDVLFAVGTMGVGAAAKAAAKQSLKSVTKRTLAKMQFQYGTKAKLAAVRSAKAALHAQVRGANIKIAGASLFFGARGATGTYAAIHDRKDLTFGEKMFYSTVVGVAEAGLTYVFKGAEQLGAEGMRRFFSKGGKEQMKQAARESLRGVSKAKNWGRAGKGMGGEWLEESGIETIDQGMDFLFSWAHGREPKAIDWMAINDAGMAGLVGTGPMSVMGAASTGMYHSSLQKNVDNINVYLDSIDEQMLLTDKGTKAYSILEAKKKRALTNLALLQGKSQEQYDKLTDSEKETVGGLNRDLANLKQEINETKDTDSKKALEAEYERKYQLKEEIEKAAENRSPVQSAYKAKNAKGEEKTATAEDVSPETKEANDSMREANDSEKAAEPKAQEAPEDVVEEEVTPEEAVTPEVEDNSIIIEPGQDIDFGAEWVGSGPGKIAIPILNQVKKLKKAFGGVIDKYGVKVQMHLTPESYRKATGAGKNSFGMYDSKTKTIHITPQSTKADVQEEFGHAVFRTLMGTNSKLRQEVYKELAVMNRLIIFNPDGSVDISSVVNVNNGNDGLNEDGTAPDFVSSKAKSEYEANPVLKAIVDTELLYKDRDVAQRQEETIMSALTAYAANPNKFKSPKGEGFINRVIRMINRVMKIGGYKGNFITSQDSFFSMASKFKQATEGVETDVETRAEDYADKQPGGLESKRFQLRPNLDNTDVQVKSHIENGGSTFLKGVDQGGQPVSSVSIFPERSRLIDGKEITKEDLDKYIEDNQDLLKGNNDVLAVGTWFDEKSGKTYLDISAVVPHKNAIDLGKQYNQKSVFNLETYEEVDTEGTGEAIEGLKPELGRVDDIRALMPKLESKRFQPRPNLDNTEVFFTQTVWGERADATSYVQSVRERSINVNDYWHFYNLYAKFTGNGADKSRMEDMFYVKDGVKYPIEPPPPKRDRNTREILEMPVPYMENYRQRQSRLRLEEGELRSELSRQRAAIKSEVGDLWRNNEKNINQYTNLSDFTPGERDDFVSMRREEVEDITAAIEKEVIAKKNIQALIDSDITEEDLKLLQGPNNVIFKSEQPSIFNMSGLTPFSEAQDGEAFGEESVPDTDGLESRKFELKGSLSKVLTENRGDIREVSGLMSRLFGYDRTKKDSGVRDLMNKTFKMDDGTEVGVITAHRRAKEARLVFNDLTKLVEKELPGMEVGDIGYIATMEALLGEESTLGNPAVFKRAVNKYGSIETFENLLNAKNKTARSQFRNIVEDGALDSNNESLISLFEQTKPQEDIKLDQTHVKALKEIVAPKQETKSFKARTNMLKVMLNDSQKNEIYAQENDSAWGDVNTAEIVSFTKIPFRKTEDGWEGFTKRTDRDKKSPFTGLIVSDGTIDEKPQLKVVNELYTIPEVFPDLKIKVTQKEVDLGESEVVGLKPKPKEYVSISELTPDEQMKQASTRAAISRVEGRALTSELNQAQDVSMEELTMESRRFESRGGMVDVETDGGPFQLREKTWFQEWRGKWLRRLADKYYDVMQIQEDIERAKGSAVKEAQDFKMAEERMYGKAANDLQKLEERTKEMTGMMKEMGLTQGEISDYMYALHAKERNALILERDGVENGSGMTDAEADALLAGLDPSKKANMDKVLKIIRDIQQDTRDTMVKLGLESQETIDVFEAQFENYVPLAGIATDETDSGTSSYPTGGAGMAVQGEAYKKAKGRKTQAQNLLAQVISQNASIHIKGRTNEALQSLHELVTQNPNSKVWSIVDTASYGDAHVVPVRINGEQKYIRFADSSYAETLKGMSVPRTSALVKILRAPANWLRRSFTTLNPEFVISNFSRDIQAAVFNAMAESDMEGGALLGTDTVKDMLNMVGPSLKTLVKGVAGKSGDPMIEKYYAEFQEDGGKTGWAYAKSLADIAADIEKETTDSTTAQNILGKAERFAEAIEGVNDAFENSIRLAAYIAARENGVSRGKAAQLAKNITVNFNKHGEYGQALNAVYLFFNASIQGTMRLGRSLLTLKPPVKPNGVKAEWYERMNGAQKLAAGLTVFSAMLTTIARAMSDEDEDGILYYDKIPDYVKERNLIFMFDGENYIKVPMPYGFNIFANLGTAAVETSQGAKEVDEAMLFLGNSFMGAFSPVSFGQSKDIFTSIGKSATPTVLKPIVEIMTNETYFGGPVYAAQSPYASPKPESSMSFRSPKAVQEFFEWVNETTGGSKHVPGNTDINPDKFWHIFDYFLGGAGQFVTRTGETAFKVGQKLTVDNEVQVEFNDVPLLRKMYGEPARYYDFEKFKEREVEINQLVREYKDERSDDVDRYKGLGSLNKKLKSINKKLKVLRAKKREARDIENYAERSVRIQTLMDKERSLVMEFNRIYDKIKNNE